MSNTNFFTFKAVVNKSATMKQSTNGIPYTGLSVGIPEFNKSSNQTEYTNVYVQAWKELAEILCAPDAKGMYRFTGKIKSFQPTNGQGQSSMVTVFEAGSVEKLVYIQRDHTVRPNAQTMPPGRPAISPNGFQQQPPVNQGSAQYDLRSRDTQAPQQAPNGFDPQGDLPF